MDAFTTLAIPAVSAIEQTPQTVPVDEEQNSGSFSNTYCVIA